MGFLQDWLDEPDEKIARFAKAFYVTTYLFLAMFVWQLVQLMQLWEPGTFQGGHAAAPMFSLFLAAAMYALALDGRRSYKAMKAGKAAAPATTGEPLSEPKT